MFKSFSQSKRPGSVVIMIICVVLFIIMLLVMAVGAGMAGDRTGVGSGQMIGDGISDNTGTVTDSSTDIIGCNNVPTFKQCDSRWGSQQYIDIKGGEICKKKDGITPADICSSGCGVSAAAMVLKFYGKDVNPSILAQDSAKNGYRVCGSGTARGFFPYIAQKYGLKAQNGISWSQVLQYLKQGKPVIVSGRGPAPFTDGGHYIVLTCYNESNQTISVNDSNRANTVYPEATIRKYQYFRTIIYQ